MELLQTFMECSIAILAFSAIVSEFRKQSKAKWNVRLYQGIIAHTIQAFVYSGLPLLAAAFSVNENSIWTTCGLILGGVTFIQGIGVMVSDKRLEPKGQVDPISIFDQRFGITASVHFWLSSLWQRGIFYWRVLAFTSGACNYFYVYVESRC